MSIETEIILKSIASKLDLLIEEIRKVGATTQETRDKIQEFQRDAEGRLKVNAGGTSLEHKK